MYQVGNWNGIVQRLWQELKNNNVLVCISGASCSGKSTLAKDLADEFKDYAPLVICQDAWFNDRSDIVRDANGYFDLECPAAFHIDEFKKEMSNVLNGGEIIVPIYDISKNVRIGYEESVKAGQLIIAEELHTILLMQEITHPCKTINIMLDTDIYLCSDRRAKRDMHLCHKNVFFIKSHYINVIYPQYSQFLKEQIRLLRDDDFLL